MGHGTPALYTFPERRMGPESKPVEPRPGRQHIFLTRRKALASAGILLLVLWSVWWFASVRCNRLVGGQRTWVPCWSFLNLDFLSVYYDARHWTAGGDPYHENTKPEYVRPFGLDYRYSYPPIVLRLYSWCRFVPPSTAGVVWTVLLTLMAAVGAWAAWRTRWRLGLTEMPLPLALACVLCSTPIFYAMERGNCDLLILPLLVVSAWALQAKTMSREIVAGSVMALAAWIKIYPGILILGLLALRRWRATACFLVVAAAIGLADLKGTHEFAHNIRVLIGSNSFDSQGIWSPSTHSLTGCWKILWAGTALQWLTRIPGLLGGACFIVPMALWVSYRLSRCASPGLVIYPYLVWLVAAGTFMPQIANDYNLCFLPVAVVALWDRRDTLLVHVLIAFLLLWWQPFELPIGPRLLFIFKYLGLLAAGASLIQRMREAGQGLMKPSIPDVPSRLPPPMAA